jgi:WD40 repeat protein
VGTAKVKLSFDAWVDGKVVAAEYVATVARPKAEVRLEPVSPRLKATLQHPTRRGTLSDMRYSPDGTKLLAASYPEGVIQLWHAADGRELTKIEVPGRRLSGDYALLAPDWSTVYTPIYGRDFERVERDGKALIRWTMKGEVRSWNLATGRPGPTFRADPACNPLLATVSPDGRWLMTLDELSGEVEGDRRRGASLWEVATGRRRALPEMSPGTFAPDSTAFAAVRTDSDYNDRAIDLIDAESGRTRRTFPTGVRFGSCGLVAFSSDGRRLYGTTREYPDKDDRSTWQDRHVAWDAATGRAVASFPAETPKTSMAVSLSPDGRAVAVATWAFRKADEGVRAKAYLLDADTLAPRHSVDFGPDVWVAATAFRRDGRRLAVVTRAWGDGRRTRSPSADEHAQPKVHLIDTATGAVRATLVLPQCFCRAVAFSPDGKTLAAGGSGQVLLFDVGDL